MVISKLYAIGWGALVASVALLAACSSSSEESAATCVGHTSSAASTPMAKPVSFKDDILPIFQQSCVFSSCHGSPARNNGIYLGAKGSVNATEIRDALVGKSSARMPSMKYVTPGKPERSYLLHKLDGNFCGLDACADGKCGERMPRGGDALDEGQISLVQAWIAQGASDR